MSFFNINNNVSEFVSEFVPEVELETAQTSLEDLQNPLYNGNLLTKQNSRKTSSLWSYIDYETQDNPGEPICKKCNFVFSSKSGNSIMERHLEKQHSIIIPKIRNKQTVLNFKYTTPWPAREKAERDHSVVIWTIADQQPFSVVENKKFIEMMNLFDPRYKVPDRHQ